MQTFVAVSTEEDFDTICFATISHNFQDKKQQTVVNNNSGQIMKMLNSAFDELCSQPTCPDLFPNHLQEEINQLNDYMSDTINTGVYKCGFTQSQVMFSHSHASTLHCPLLQTWWLHLTHSHKESRSRTAS